MSKGLQPSSSAPPGSDWPRHSGRSLRQPRHNEMNLRNDQCEPGASSTTRFTAMEGHQHAVTLSGGEDADCWFTGPDLTGAKRSALRSGSPPTVAICHTLRNLGVGMGIAGDSKPTIATCIFAAHSRVWVGSSFPGAPWPCYAGGSPSQPRRQGRFRYAHANAARGGALPCGACRDGQQRPENH
jgi:hypothetical protein